MKKLKEFLAMLPIYILIIVFFPLILIVILLALISSAIDSKKMKKLYINSHYFKELNIPYSFLTTLNNAYRFYNSARIRGLDFEFFVKENPTYTRIEYFIYGKEAYAFPIFESVFFDIEKNEWMADCDGYITRLDEKYEEVLALISVGEQYKVNLFLERSVIAESDLTLCSLPSYVYLTLEYETAFENDSDPLFLKIPSTSAELFEMMQNTPQLCKGFELKDDIIHFDLSDGYLAMISADKYGCQIDIVKKTRRKIVIYITHWHPEHYELYPTIKNMGTKGNIVVVRKHLFGKSVLYCGREELCPYDTEILKAKKGILYLKIEETQAVKAVMTNC